MKILIASSEATPFAKTGGLADVCGALPVQLNRAGVHSSVILPAYRDIYDAGVPIQQTDVRLEVRIGAKMERGRLLQSHLPGSDVPVYFVAHDHYFDRAGIYGESGRDYRDNCERFVFFCHGVMQAIDQLGLHIDLVHANDWSSGLLCPLAAITYANVPGFEHLATLLTIHNLAYQGSFWHWDMLLTGLDWKYFNLRQMECHGRLNLLKTGLVFADAITTVSPQYAEEIQTPPLSCGLEGVLQHRRDSLKGILNGVDYELWNPATDRHIPANYDASTVNEGKPVCKKFLQEQVGLAPEPNVPLIGLVGRLVEQKGVELVVQSMERWVVESDAQWVLLGSGDPRYEDQLRRLAADHPHKVAVEIGFSDVLAHRIEAGADLFLMPSEYEPCGLNQLYSLKYGTVPLVHRTGGLADTVTDANPETMAAETATGFSFWPFDRGALDDALQRAFGVYEQADQWSRIVQTGMAQDWSWARSAREYIRLYEQTIARKKQLSLVD